MVGTSGMVPARNKAFVGKEKKRKRKREKKMRHYHQGKLKNLIINFCTGRFEVTKHYLFSIVF